MSEQIEREKAVLPKAGADAEREAVVKYLRDVAATKAPTSVFQSAYRCLADEIEEGEHVR